MGILLGVRIDQVTKNQALDQSAGFLSERGQHTIFTPNPEMLVAAQKYPWLREILNKGNLNLCDGIGTAFFAKTERIAGVDFMLDLCGLAAEQGRSVYLLGSGDIPIIRAAGKELQRLFPKLKIVGSHPGPIIKFQISACPDPSIGDCRFQIVEENDKEIVHGIIQTNPDIIFVAFGHGKQEWWISEYLKVLPSVKIAMGVGGAFDMLAGKQTRAPEWLRSMGCEWLWRLCIEPRRFSRILTAVFVFPFLVLKERYF